MATQSTWGTHIDINMRIALFISLAFVAVYAAPSSELSDAEYQSLFAQFQSEHSVSYLSEEHASNKFTVFKDNVDFINDHNQNHADRLGYTVSMNQFADLTLNEFRRQYLGFHRLDKHRCCDRSEEPRKLWQLLGILHYWRNRGPQLHRQWQSGLALRARAG